MNSKRQKAIDTVTKFPSKLAKLTAFQNDKEVVLAAVKKYGYALEFAAPELQDDETVVMAATSSIANALQYANNRFWARRDLVLAYIQFQLAEYYEIEDFSELSTEQLEDEDGPFRFLDLDLVRDTWESRPGLKCPKCGGRHIYYYQGVPACNTYFAYEVDFPSGEARNEVEICPRMDRVDRVESQTLYLCHGCMKQWGTWDECKSACLI